MIAALNPVETEPPRASSPPSAELSEQEAARRQQRMWNLPNFLTMLRLVFAVMLFMILGWTAELPLASSEASAPPSFLYDGALLLKIGFAIFLLAAISDTLDGQIARAWQLETDFGRIADPFADKVIICGSFVLLTPFEEIPVAPWMVVVVLGREFLVNGIRGFAESRGVKFGADWSGKLKMLSQCVAVASAVFFLGVWIRAGAEPPRWATIFLPAAVYGAVGLTVISGVLYVARARRALAGQPA